MSREELDSNLCLLVSPPCLTTELVTSSNGGDFRFWKFFSEFFLSAGLALLDVTDDGDSTLGGTSSLSVDVSTLLTDRLATFLNVVASSFFVVIVVVVVVVDVVVVVGSP
jgi:hypothetical protein